jgi:hypothetical protein
MRDLTPLDRFGRSGARRLDRLGLEIDLQESPEAAPGGTLPRDQPRICSASSTMIPSGPRM